MSTPPETNTLPHSTESPSSPALPANSGDSKPQSPLSLTQRPRRNRATEAVRSLIRETSINPSNLIYPLFVHAGSDDQPIDAMPGCKRWSPAGILTEIARAHTLGINAIILFPAIEDALKNPTADEAWNPEGLIPNIIQSIKYEFPQVLVITDVALDPYNSDGHDGVVDPDGTILNDTTVAILVKQALAHAQAGADIVAPSDMMDGRIGAIRAALDAENFTSTAIMSYTAKYASAYYGPFRGALDSAPKSGDKKTYQMDPANAREAIRELQLDASEGADIIMVKPAGPYLDVIHRLRQQTTLPVAAYQVSGEYVMIKTAAAGGYLNEDKLILESLLGIRRAGADMILTYFAPRAAELMQN